MSNPSQNNHRPRVARRKDKLTVKSREDRSTTVQKNAPTYALWLQNPKLQASGEDLIQAGADLSESEKVAQALRLQLDSAEKEVRSFTIRWDTTFNIYAGNVEHVAVKPEDITNLGLTLLEEATNKLAPPLSVSARYDLVTSQIRILVRKPEGNFGCRIEISPNPIAPGSFQALKGKGARRALSGYPPGGYWVQALLFDNESESDYSPPVFVIVP